MTLFIQRCLCTQPINNGEVFTAKKICSWLARPDVKPIFIELRKPNGISVIEFFNGKMIDEFLDGQIFYQINKGGNLIDVKREEYNTVSPQISLGY